MRFAPTVSIFLILTMIASPAWADRRVALVIGIGAYEHTRPLANPLNDTADVAESFERLGFEVSRATNATKQELEGTISRFMRDARRVR